ncbi:MAG: hypothetical protein OHK005_04360 [Candidatus Methylacidiphilales bacterium]
MFNTLFSTTGSVDPWRAQAAAIVEEILVEAPREEVDQLLDLRAMLLRGEDWSEALDLFLKTRIALEARFYLPFYRLRTLLAAKLRLDPHGWEGVDADLRRMLRLNYRSLQAIREALARERFERDLPDTGAELRVVEA